MSTKNYKPVSLALLALVSGLSLTLLTDNAAQGKTRHRQGSAVRTGAPAANTNNGHAKTAGLAASSSKSNLALTVDAWLSRPEIKYSRVGVEIYDVNSGQILYESNGSKRHTPASTAKVLTTACLYDLYGGDFVYKTRLLTNGSVKDDTLKGDLILDCSQDPSFSRGDLEGLVASLKRLSSDGLKRIDGKIYEFAPPESRDNFHVNWLIEDFGQEWMPVSSSLVVDKNIAYVGGIPKIYKVEDVTKSGLALVDGVLAADLASSFLAFDEASGVVRLYWGLAMGSNGKPDPKIHRDGPFVVGNPTDYNIGLFTASLTENNFSFARPVIKSEKVLGFLSKQPRTTLVEHCSKPLSQLIKLCLYESDNLYAQQFLRTLSISPVAASGGDKKKAVSSASLEERGLWRLGEWLSQIGVPNSQVVLFDGCGLSRKNAITPHALNLVLAHMYKTKPQYLDLLRASDVKGGGSRYSFKTGAMDTVRGLSGVLENKGRVLAITTLVNGHTPSVRDVRIVLADLIERVRRCELPAAPAASAAKAAKAIANPNTVAKPEQAKLEQTKTN
ncbi:MAG: D-alanyl-D-alanine carboxypeptidase/D-alanyl-D-alanine-endopeptidase [Candidatus Obscuribacter sp.]|nr:D-alanyl-D-alanine carboxypeptidase/D-alanyl-D-alanine-endopeptidase [Candidatus Obscuribacter sp.]